MARSKKNPGPSEQDPIRALADEIAGVGLICSGTLLERTKTCGKPNCRCATDPQARHGPYYEWTWREDGKFRHKIVPAEKVDLLREAIQNRRTVQELLGRWERESATIIFAGPDRKSRPGKKIN
ncbi:MAG: DUF6788 family protein [Gemmatimonadota bacterium]|jgi:hypothetical protein